MMQTLKLSETHTSMLIKNFVTYWQKRVQTSDTKATGTHDSRLPRPNAKNLDTPTIAYDARDYNVETTPRLSITASHAVK